MSHQVLKIDENRWFHRSLILTHTHITIQQINGHFRNLNWRYLPYIRPIFEAYVRGYTPKIWPKIWY